jgi:hypothetical protein
MKIVAFIIEMILGVIPATLLVPLALLGSMFSIVGTSKGLMWVFHPYGIMGFFGLAGTVGLWFVVPHSNQISRPQRGQTYAFDKQKSVDTIGNKSQRNLRRTRWPDPYELNIPAPFIM